MLAYATYGLDEPGTIGQATNMLPRPSILIVESDRFYRRLLEYVLSKHLDIRTAASGKEAWSCIQERRPDLVISNLARPGLDGWGLFEKLRSESKYYRIKYIMHTAAPDVENQAAELGIDDYIPKGCSVDEVLERILAVLKD